jgi:hypothetical protein
VKSQTQPYGSFSLPLFSGHAALFVELGLGDGALEVAHAVRLQPQDEVEGRDGDVLEVVGPVLVGGAVEVGRAHRLDDVEEAAAGVLAPVEHQVLEQVGAVRPGRSFLDPT